LILDSWTRARSGGMEHSHYLTRFRTVVLFWLMTTPDGDDYEIGVEEIVHWLGTLRHLTHSLTVVLFSFMARSPTVAPYLFMASSLTMVHLRLGGSFSEVGALSTDDSF
jgi:hypothetical protein